jgi:hypothetical protein
MKPKLLSDVLRQNSPRKFLNKGNYYSVLRDVSPADSTRSTFSSSSRSLPVKRKIGNEGNEIVTGQGNMQYAAVAAANIVPAPAGIQVTVSEDLTEEIVKVKSLCEKVGRDLCVDGLDPKLVTIFASLNEAIFGICNVQQGILNSAKQGNQQAYIQVAHKKPRQETHLVDLASITTSQQHKVRQVSQEDIKVKKFRDAIKDAEKSTLLFNLDMGKVPTINMDTMSSKVTTALGEMAATQENAKGKIPGEDTLAAIDDVLSVAKNMKFLGKVTKTYRNNKDTRSGSFCTIPVRYDFYDKESRIYAENLLREKCKVQCATPYPLITRECIKQIIEQVKTEFPNTYVRVAVDTEDMCFRVYKRPMVDKNYKGKKDWSSFEETVPIPELTLDLSVRRVLEDFKLMGIQFRKKNSPRKSRKSSDMETGEQAGATGAVECF